ncbi:lipase 3 [Stomoxys calcitrans]|uniref:lipase 3 n=1 Tax=Stomoxys calcitrans TaxID=35570 RepID=UPI0027E2E672|nr:lipase 3 [Stomoxys calcitrans]
MRKIFVVSLIVVPILLIVLRQQQQQNDKEKIITTADRVRRAGFDSASYDIYTKDGYGLTLFRLRNPLTSTTPSPAAPVVLLMHGFTSSSDVWVIEGMKNPLAYDLLRQGYDVWLGNNRGNMYGQRHRNISIWDREFWRFSFHEIGINDLPQMIDFILEETQQTSLHYVGYSQGTTIAMVLLSMKPEYNAKFKTINLLAPTIFMTNGRSKLRYLGRFFDSYTPLHTYVGDMAVFRPKLLRKLLGFERCRSPQANAKVCAAIIYNLFGGYSAYLEEALIPDIFNSHPATSALHQLFHFLQIHRSQKFRQYDIGSEGNLRRYNQSLPPEYNLSNVNPRLPIHMFYSDYDELSSKTDVESLAHILGNRSVSHFIDLEHYSHLDFVWGNNTKEIINKPILKILKEAEVLWRSDKAAN